MRYICNLVAYSDLCQDSDQDFGPIEQKSFVRLRFFRFSHVSQCFDDPGEHLLAY